MAVSSPLINKHITRQETHNYLYTSMVAHRGVPVSFAMRDDGRIFYSVLDMSNTEQNTNTPAGADRNNDKNFWSKVKFEGAGASCLPFPSEIVQVGYGVVPNFQINKYDSKNKRIIHGYDDDGKPLDAKDKVLSEKEIREKTDHFYSSTARLGATAPFQVLTDTKYIYLFRQSIAKEDPNNEKGDPEVEGSEIVNRTLLVDRFILSGSVLKPSREIRYQRSRHKTEPASRKDTLAAVDVEGNPFYEPTRELVFARNVSDGNFSVLLIPGADSEEQRWQIFTIDDEADKVNSFNIRFDHSIVFDTSDSQEAIDAFIQKYELDKGFILDIEEKIDGGKRTDNEIVGDLLKKSEFQDIEDGREKEMLKDTLGEVLDTVRLGVDREDFFLESASEWPLIEYHEDGNIKKENDKGESYLDEDDVLLGKFSFSHGAGKDALRPESSRFSPKNGLSSCYYYQQELGPDGKPMKNKACVMLSVGLEDEQNNKYIGILNFAAAASGHLSRPTVDSLNLPDINVQAMDENPYSRLEDIPTDDKNRVAWQRPEKMNLIDIDSNGLSTSGGVLKFAYTTADVGTSQGYSDAVEATNPYLFDDSLGRVNLYFMGRKKNFFVLYFNPTGSKSVTVVPALPDAPVSPLSLKPRLDQDMNIDVKAKAPVNTNTCTLEMVSDPGGVVEVWANLPRRFSQIAEILNGNGTLPLGTLEPLGKSGDPRAAYTAGEGDLSLRTTMENNLMFKVRHAHADKIADGKIHTLSLGGLSSYLRNNSTLRIANKSFSLITDKKVALKADLFYQSYLSGMVSEEGDMNLLWSYLLDKGLIKAVTGQPDRAHPQTDFFEIEKNRPLTDLLADEELDALPLELLKEGNKADKKARRARLKQSLIALIRDVAKVRILTFKVQDENMEQVDRLGAGLAVSVNYDYSHFNCSPQNLSALSASKWEHARSYLFDAALKYDENSDATTEITDDFAEAYNINNTIGQWEDWEASLAMELNEAALHTTDKLEALQPSEKGLSLEAWVKPAVLNGSILCYKNGDRNYSLGIESAGTGSEYKCVATLGGKKYTTDNAFSKGQWRHLAFTHKKYWGYQLKKNKAINCGNDSSLQLADEFSMEVLVKIDGHGTLLEKTGEYKLSVTNDGKVIFKWGNGTNNLVQGSTLTTKAPLNEFCKITLIRSRNKPRTKPTAEEYPITGGKEEAQECSGSKEDKWYADADGDTDKLIKGMAERQDQMNCQMKDAKTNMLGGALGSFTGSEYTTAYYHSLIITNGKGSPKEWTSPSEQDATPVEAYQDFSLGGGSFTGTFSSVRIWNRALSPEEAKALTLAENKTALLSHWRMSEGKGKYLYDEVSENHGVVDEDGGKWVDSPQGDQPGQFQFYVDGTPEDHKESNNSTIPKADQFSLGGVKTDVSSFSKYFKGTLEEVRVWNTPRTNEQITDNAFGRLKGEWEQLLANYTFDKPVRLTENLVQDSGLNSVQLAIDGSGGVKEVLSTAPIATEIPQVRSALTGVLTDYNGYIRSRPGVVEYGDVQQNEDGTLNGILKRCYSFIDEQGVWNRMTGYKVGNLISQWYSQAQFAPQVMGYLEGPPPVPAENFPVGKDGDVDTYAYKLNNSAAFRQAEEVAYNYSTSKEAGWNAAVESEMTAGAGMEMLVAPLGFGMSIEVKGGVATASNWEHSAQRSHSYERGTSVNTERTFGAALAGYDNGKEGNKRYYKMGNTGYALVKSKTADVFLLRLAHNNALVSIFWKPNPDIPEDVNIIPFPINPLYTKQGTLDGKFGDTTDDHYPQAHGAYGQYSYFKPREAYKLKKQIEREKLELRAYFEDGFDVARTNAHFQAAQVTTGLAQVASLWPAVGTMITSAFNQTAGLMATQVGYNNTNLKEDLAKMGSQRSLVNSYVWTVEGGFFAESTEVAATQQETYANESSLSMGGGIGLKLEAAAGAMFEQQTLVSSGSSFTLTKSKTKESSNSFGLDISVDVPTSPRYKYTGADGLTLTHKGLIKPGTVDAYRFMSFYLEPKGENFTELFSKVIDPIWLDENPDPNAQALRQARGNVDKKKPCWRIMHRVTYVSRILPEFRPEAPPSLEKSMRVSGIESNYMLIKKFEPYLKGLSDPGDFSAKVEEVLDTQLPEFKPYKTQITSYLRLYFNLE